MSLISTGNFCSLRRYLKYGIRAIIIIENQLFTPEVCFMNIIQTVALHDDHLLLKLFRVLKNTFIVHGCVFRASLF